MLQSKETQRESRILRGFVCLRAKKRSVNHVLYVARVCVLQSKETKRESRILRGFVCVRVKTRSVNHVFYDSLCAAERSNTA